jgi:hypothetical protein
MEATMSEQTSTIQPASARKTYRSPKLNRFGQLANLVEGGSTPSAFESITTISSPG